MFHAFAQLILNIQDYQEPYHNKQFPLAILIKPKMSQIRQKETPSRPQKALGKETVSHL